MLGLRFFSVTHLEYNLVIAPLRANTIKSTSPSGITCLLYTQFQAIR